MRDAWFRLRQVWCRLMHPAPMWPIRGFYYCPRCGLAHEVRWEQPLKHDPARKSK
ncbi:MAG: acetone carboxylase subunit gamma [Rhodospirillales bacterium]